MEQLKIEDLNNYKALLFDCDGTLAESMKCHCMAYKTVFAHLNIPFTEEDFYKYAAKGGKTLLKALVIDKGYSSEIAEKIKIMKSEAVSDFLDQHMIPNTELINFIKQHHLNFKMAVVSNGRRQSIMTILSKLGIIQYFDAIFTAEDYIVSKPYPEPYVVAYKKLGVNPAECLVFEDDENGYKSATTAGLNVKMVKIKE